jgi:hypothetical protein
MKSPCYFGRPKKEEVISFYTRPGNNQNSYYLDGGDDDCDNSMSSSIFV